MQQSKTKTKEYSYNLDLENHGTAARTLKLVGKNKKVLELGCSVGTQSKVLTEVFNCSVTGIEINPEAASKAQAYCSQVIIGDLNNFDFYKELNGEKYDVVLCADVLEHVYDPTLLLDKIKPIINHDGYLVASIPNIVHIALLIEMLNGRFEYKETGLLDDSHIRFFTRNTIVEMFSQAGFVIEHLDRGLVDLNDTEFPRPNNSPEVRNVLNYIRKNNEECNTYHFILKAKPVEANLFEIKSKNRELELSTLTELNRSKQEKIENLEKKINRLSSELAWLENSPLLKLSKIIKSLFFKSH